MKNELLARRHSFRKKTHKETFRLPLNVQIFLFSPPQRLSHSDQSLIMVPLHDHEEI